jgi:RNA polymerase sigma-70 factor (ECF subfamily)
MMNNDPLIAGDVIPDREIIDRILRGEKELYALIVRRYNQRLYRVGISIVHDEAEIEDIMQVAYISAYENLSKFAFKSSFSTWITRILINECLLRLKKRGRSIHMNSNESFYSDVNQEAAIDGHTPMTSLLNNELKIVLEDCIRRLPEKYRLVFVMREIEGMNIADTRECLDISEANVKVRLNRARALLRETLGDYYKKEELLHFHLSRCDRMVTIVMDRLQLNQP